MSREGAAGALVTRASLSGAGHSSSSLGGVLVLCRLPGVLISGTVSERCVLSSARLPVAVAVGPGSDMSLRRRLF